LLSHPLSRCRPQESPQLQDFLATVPPTALLGVPFSEDCPAVSLSRVRDGGTVRCSALIDHPSLLQARVAPPTLRCPAPWRFPGSTCLPDGARGFPRLAHLPGSAWSIVECRPSPSAATPQTGRSRCRAGSDLSRSAPQSGRPGLARNL